jgi:hypothetical protein
LRSFDTVEYWHVACIQYTFTVGGVESNSIQVKRPAVNIYTVTLGNSIGLPLPLNSLISSNDDEEADSKAGSKAGDTGNTGEACADDRSEDILIWILFIRIYRNRLYSIIGIPWLCLVIGYLVNHGYSGLGLVMVRPLFGFGYRL